MKHRYSSFIPVILISLSLVSCERWKCIEGNGNRITETRELSTFDGIINSSEFEVYITVDTSLSVPIVKVTADDNLLPYIKTTVRSGNLELSANDKRCLESDMPVYVDVALPSLVYAELSGSGLINCEGLNEDRLQLELTGSGFIEFFDVDCGYIDVNLPGSGKIELTGYALQTDMSLSGSGQIRAHHLEQKGSYVDLSGSGDIFLLALDFIRGEISGSGWIYYRVRPLELDIVVSGSGGYGYMK